MEKGQTGVSLRKGQYKRLGRIAAKNPDRAGRVADRMIERDTRLSRGKAFVASKLAGKPTMKKGGKVAAKKKK